MIFLLFAIPKIYLYRGMIWGNMRIELVIGRVHHQYINVALFISYFCGQKLVFLQQTFLYFHFLEFSF